MNMRKILNLIEETSNNPALENVDLSSWENFNYSLRKMPREQLTQLQGYMNEIVKKTDTRPPNAIELYHGAPQENAEKIRANGFELTKGKRSGAFGAINLIDNQGIFLTDSKAMANYFGSNRSKYGNDFKMFTCYVDPSNFLDADGKIAPTLRKFGIALLKKWDGFDRTKIPVKEWWWLLDKPEFVQIIKESGYQGVKFREDKVINKAAQTTGHTYLVFDPSTIVIKGRNGVETVRDFYDWLVKNPSSNINESLDIIDNQNGIGNVPMNMNVNYAGLRAKMHPSIFLDLAAQLTETRQSLSYIIDQLKNGAKIGAPFLMIDIPEEWENGDYSKPAKVVGHEGRHRMKAIKTVFGDELVETHIFVRGYRARHLKPEWVAQMQTQLVIEKTNRVFSHRNIFEI